MHTEANGMSLVGTFLPNARTLLHSQLAIGDGGKLGRPSGYDPELALRLSTDDAVNHLQHERRGW